MSTQAIDAAASVAERIHLLMWRKRMSQAQLAKALGITQASISRKLRGVVPMTVAELIEICRVLEVHPAELLPRLDSNQQPSGYRLALVSRPARHLRVVA